MFLRLLLTLSLAVPPTEDAARTAYNAGDLEVALKLYLELAEAPGAHPPTALDGAHATLRALHEKEPEAGHLCRARDMARELLKRDDFATDQERTAWTEMEAEDAGDLAGVTCPAPPSLPPAEQVRAAPEGPAALPVPKDSPPPWRPRGRVAAASVLGAVGVGLLGWMGGALVGRARANDQIAAITTAAMADDRGVTPAERGLVADATDRYRRLDGTAKGVGIAGAVILLTSLAVLLVPPRDGSQARVRASGAGLVYSF